MPPQQRARKTTQPAPGAEPALDETASATDAAADGAAAADSGPAAPEAPAPKAEPEPEPGPICGQCFAGGWNALPPDAATAGCEHGTYTR